MGDFFQVAAKIEVVGIECLFKLPGKAHCPSSTLKLSRRVIRSIIKERRSESPGFQINSSLILELPQFLVLGQVPNAAGWLAGWGRVEGKGHFL